MAASLSSCAAESVTGTAAWSSGLGTDAPDRCWRLPPFLSSRYRYGRYSQVTRSSNVTVSTPVLKSSCGLRASTGGAASRKTVTPCHHRPVVNSLPPASYMRMPSYTFMAVLVLPAILTSILSWSAAVSVTVTSLPETATALSGDR